MNLVIRNARVRGHDRLVDIAIDGTEIHAVETNHAGKGVKEIDAAGNLVSPGVKLFGKHTTELKVSGFHRSPSR